MVEQSRGRAVLPFRPPLSEGVAPLAILATLAGLAILTAYGRAAGGTDLTAATMLALLLQTATLTLAITLPLYLGDLDLSAGPVAMLGVLLLVPGRPVPPGAGPPHPSSPNVWGGAATLEAALPLALALGTLIGLAHGALIVLARLPAPLVTLASGVGLCCYLYRFPVPLAIDTPARRELLAPALGVFLGAVALTFLAALITHRLGSPAAPTLDVTMANRVPPLSWTAALALSVPLSALAILMERGPANLRHDLTSGFFLAYAPIGLPITLGAFTLLVRLLSASPWRRVFSLRSPAHRDTGALRALRPPLGFARVAALMVCSTLAAAVGTFMAAQGIRDNTFLPCAAYVVFVPLAGLIAGGQLLLTDWRRPVGATFGAILAAAACLTLLQPSDNLGGLPAVLLGTLAALAWRLAAGWRPPAAGGTSGARQGASTAARHPRVEWASRRCRLRPRVNALAAVSGDRSRTGLPGR